MQLKELGEFGLIDWIRHEFASVPHGDCRGIGDDCAVIPCGSSESLLVTTDMLVEDVHFLRSAISPYQLGRKSLAVNLSDVAAMGAYPVASFLSVALPADVSADWAEDFLRGYRSLSSEFRTPLLGGDTTSSHQGIAINVTAIGSSANRRIKYRSDAVDKDKIFVTGVLGDSAQGLIDIKNGLTDTPFIHAHLDPTPCVDEGIWLANQPEVHAMMDLSDGLASDLDHILKASGVGAEVSLELIPNNSSVELAVTGGEDYQLLLTVAATDSDRIAAEYAHAFGRPLYEVGSIVTDTDSIRWLDHGRCVNPDWQGYRHF